MQHWQLEPARPLRTSIRPVARRGTSLIELTVAVLLLGVVFALLGPAFAWIRRERRLSQDRQAATIELANQAELLSLRPYDEVTTESLATLAVSEAAQAALPGAKLTTRVSEEADPVARRVTLSLSWSEDGVRPLPPLELVVWRFPARQGGAP